MTMWLTSRFRRKQTWCLIILFLASLFISLPWQKEWHSLWNHGGVQCSSFSDYWAGCIEPNLDRNKQWLFVVRGNSPASSLQWWGWNLVSHNKQEKSDLVNCFVIPLCKIVPLYKQKHASLFHSLHGSNQKASASSRPSSIFYSFSGRWGPSFQIQSCRYC